MHITYTGSRGGMALLQRVAFTLRLVEMDVEVLTHGDCVGGDEDAHRAAKHCGVAVRIRPCTLEKQRAHCKGDEFHTVEIVADPESPLDRNKKMVDDGDHLIATPSGFTEVLRSGTWSTMRYARRVGKPMTIIWPDGTESDTW